MEILGLVKFEEMNFRTEVGLPVGQIQIGYTHRLLLLGSCFADSIGSKLTENKFMVDVNPYGTLYNPISIAKALAEIEKGKVYVREDLYFYRGQWHSPMHHSVFSHEDPDVCLQRINERILKAREWLRQLDVAFITLGSSYYYTDRKSGLVVGNCHKRPDRDFIRKRMSDSDSLREVLKQIVATLTAFNPQVQVIFTVSPIRHLRDGLHANQVSKGLLLAALDEDNLSEFGNQVYYFPAYEILLDELRDYRFYADDMAHPSPLAVAYIWDCFVRSYLDASALSLLSEWQGVLRGLQHRPVRPASDEYKSFLKQLVLKIERLKEKYPNLDVQKELEVCRIQLKA